MDAKARPGPLPITMSDEKTACATGLNITGPSWCEPHTNDIIYTIMFTSVHPSLCIYLPSTSTICNNNI